MPRPPIDLGARIRDILQHVESLPPEAAKPLPHHARAVSDLWNLRKYVERKIRGASHYANVVREHMAALDRMLLVNLVEAFERLLKELAAVCVDHLAPCVLDDRLDEFGVKGSALAAHFEAESLGRSLCESNVWLDCDAVNKRFRRLLADPFDASGGTLFVFPVGKQPPADERFRYPVMTLLWQLRHTIVHNVGVVTQSDAVKFRLLTRRQPEAPRLLVPTRDDVRYVKRFLDETAEKINERIGLRLAELLTVLHEDNPALFDHAETANRLTNQFGMPLTIAGATGLLQSP